MKKRVALARACILDPEILLYDEPTTGLDPAMIAQVDDLILQTQERHGVTSVVISHDIDCRTRLVNFGGHGYGHIFRNVVPMMKKRGYSEDEIDAILVRNPRRLLTFV